MREHIIYALIGICVVLIPFAFITKTIPKKRKVILVGMTVSAIIALVSDRLAYYYNGNTDAIAIWILRVSKFLAYATFLLIAYIFNQYIKDMLIVEGGLKKVPRSLKITDCILLIGVIILSISQSAGIYYIYDDNNLYQRMPGYFIAFLIPMAALMVQMATIIKYRKNIRKWLFVPFLIFTTMPILTAVLQFFIHGASPSSFSTVFIVVVLYCFSILDANKLLELSHKQEIEFLLEKQKSIDTLVEQTISALVEAIDAKDKYTNGHSKRVADYSALIAKTVGKSEEECKKIHRIALLHDIGKIGVPNAIINKKSKLTDEEFAIIKNHPKIGREILDKISISPELSVGASFHHERYDGRGYPFGLKGEEIPEIARIIAVADTFDAMSSKRSYRDELSIDRIRRELENGIGTQFDPVFANIMIKLIDDHQVLS